MERPDRFEDVEGKEGKGIMSSLGNLWNSLVGNRKEADLSSSERQKSQEELAAMRRKLDRKG